MANHYSFKKAYSAHCDSIASQEAAKKASQTQDAPYGSKPPDNRIVQLQQETSDLKDLARRLNTKFESSLARTRQIEEDNKYLKQRAVNMDADIRNVLFQSEEQRQRNQHFVRQINEFKHAMAAQGVELIMGQQDLAAELEETRTAMLYPAIKLTQMRETVLVLAGTAFLVMLMMFAVLVANGLPQEIIKAFR